MKKYDRPWLNAPTIEEMDPDKTWKEMTPEEKKAHVKEVSDWIRNELSKDAAHQRELDRAVTILTKVYKNK